MKNLLIIAIFSLFCISFLMAQSPQAFNYQAVARDADNAPYQNTTLGIQISLLRNNANGIADLVERHEVNTSDLGVFNLKIGEGIPVIGNIIIIDWAAHSYYLKVEMDPSGGNDYLDMGVSQLLSVPYALYAQKSGDGEEDLDTNPENEIQTLHLSGNQLSLSNGGGLIILPEDSDQQTLSLLGTNLSIENGNIIDLSLLQDGVTDADADPENEFQELSFDINTNELSLSNGNSISIPTGGTDADANPLNEIQNLSLNGYTLSLSENGGNIDLSTIQDGVNDADANPTNELQNISKSGNTVTLSNGGGSFIDDNTDADADPSNELQNLSLSGNTLTLSNDGGSIDLPSGSSNLWVENATGIDYSLGNVGINTENPSSALEVYNDDNEWEAGYFYISNSNNDYAALSGITEGSGSGISGGSFGEGPGAFFYNNDENKLALQTGDGRIGIGTNDADAKVEINHNSTSVLPTLLLRETGNDYARLDFKNTYYGNKKWSIGGYSGSSNNNSKLNFQFRQDGNAAQDQLTILGNGNIGIGNTNPDQSLVVGNNLGEGWTIPAITVGDNVGGAIEVGNGQYNISMDAAEPYNRIVSSSPDGFGLGKTEMRTSGLAIGRSPGNPADYMLAVIHDEYGMLLEREGTSNNWEFYAVDNPNYNLNLFSGGSYRGEFDGTSGEYFSVSDRNLKQDIRPMGGILDQVMKLKASRYVYKDNNPNKKQSIGFIAQDVKKIFPELVNTSQDKRTEGIHTVNYAGFGILAIKAIQEQQSQILNLEAENVSLRQQAVEQEKKTDNLEARLLRLEKLLGTD